MADIFISYAREDAAAAEKLASALEARGYSVWWDRNLAAGSRYLEETERELNAAKAVLVVWTAISIKSHWVADEAGMGRDKGSLVPITLDGVMPPLGFRQFQVLDFSRWHGADDAQFQTLCAALAKLASHAEQDVGSADKPIRAPRPTWLAPTMAVMIVIVLALGAGGAWLLARNADAGWLENEFIPQMESLLSRGDMEVAYALQKEAQQRLPASRTVEEYWPRLSWQTTITSDPAGAKVFRRAYNAGADAPWEALGVTPLKDIRIPYGYSRLRFELDGYQPLFRAVGGGGRSMTTLPPDVEWLHPFLVGAGNFHLEALDADYTDKIRVPGWKLGTAADAPVFNDFYLDRTEVTNQKFKAFVDAGGYRDAQWWPPIVRHGVTIPFPEAVKVFVDRSGVPGPATWTGGDYPKDRGDFPVTGISWYEATAYASFRRQQLPTVYHWDAAVAPSESPWLVAASNLNSDGPRAVSEGDAISYVGAFDMFGNAREWTASAVGDQRILRGGGWTDPMACMECLAPPDDRSPTNGFRLAVIRDEPATAAIAQAPIRPPTSPHRSSPVSDAIFAAYSGQFHYDDGPLDAKIEQTIDSPSWTRERISFSSPDASDRVILYLFLPKVGSPPYQIVINWPDATGMTMTNAEGYANELDFVLKSGRAVALPVMWKNFQRGDGSGLPKPGADERDRIVHMVKDTRRTIDYLETRSDIDGKMVGFYSFSWGASFAPTVLAQERRIRVAVLNTGGIPFWPLMPEIDPVNAAPRVTIPILMMKGRYDSIVTVENSDLLYRLLGTPAADKKRFIEESGHFAPRAVVVRETLAWLDKYLGPPLQQPRS